MLASARSRGGCVRGRSFTAAAADGDDAEAPFRKVSKRATPTRALEEALLRDLEATREADWAAEPLEKEKEGEKPKEPSLRRPLLRKALEGGLPTTTRTAPTRDRRTLRETRDPSMTVRRTKRDSRTSAAHEAMEATEPARMGRVRSAAACVAGLPRPADADNTMGEWRTRGSTPRRPMTTAAAVRVA